MDKGSTFEFCQHLGLVCSMTSCIYVDSIVSHVSHYTRFSNRIWYCILSTPDPPVLVYCLAEKRGQQIAGCADCGSFLSRGAPLWLAHWPGACLWWSAGDWATCAGSLCAVCILWRQKKLWVSVSVLESLRGSKNSWDWENEWPGWQAQFLICLLERPWIEGPRC